MKRLASSGARLGQRPIRTSVFLPVVAEEVQAAEPLRPDEQALCGAEPILEERPVDGLDEGVESEIRLRCSPGTVSVTSAMSRGGGGNSRLAEEGQGDGLASLRGVDSPALEPESRAGRGTLRVRRAPDRPGMERFRPPAEAM